MRKILLMILSAIFGLSFTVSALADFNPGAPKTETKTPEKKADKSQAPKLKILNDTGVPINAIPESAGYTEAFQLVASQPSSEDRKIILATAQNIKTVYPSYIYEMSRRHFKFAPDEAAVWYMVAGMRAKYDAMRCTDVTARQGINHWPNYVPQVRDYLSSLKATKRNKLIKAAKKHARAIGLKTSPQWICFHGTEAMRKAINKQEFTNWKTPEAEWQRTLDEVLLSVKLEKTEEPEQPPAKKTWFQMNGYEQEDRIAELLPQAKKGKLAAQLELAQIYHYSGFRDVRDEGKSLHWHKQAAENGDVRTQHDLGFSLFFGTGFPRDPVNGYKWLIIAKRSGGTGFSHIQERIDSDLSEREKAEAEQRAEKWLKQNK